MLLKQLHLMSLLIQHLLLPSHLTSPIGRFFHTCPLFIILTTKITLAKVTHINRFRKISYIKLNKNMELVTNSGSMFDKQLTPGDNTWYWFAFTETGRIVDMAIAVDGGDLVVNLLSKHKNLVDSTEAITQTFSQCDSAELSYVLQYVGTGLSAAWTVWNGIQTINACLAWEPVNLCINLGMTAATGVFTKMQYKRLNDTQRSAVAATKQFETALASFHAVIKAYAPESMRDYAVASPAFTGIHNKLYQFLPKMDVTSLETNRPNWCVA